MDDLRIHIEYVDQGQCGMAAFITTLMNAQTLVGGECIVAGC